MRQHGGGIPIGSRQSFSYRRTVSKEHWRQAYCAAVRFVAVSLCLIQAHFRFSPRFQQPNVFLKRAKRGKSFSEKDFPLLWVVTGLSVFAKRKRLP